LWPSNSCTVLISTPAITKRLAKVCRRSCQVKVYKLRILHRIGKPARLEIPEDATSAEPGHARSAACPKIGAELCQQTIAGVHLSAMQKEKLEAIQTLFNRHWEAFRQEMQTVVPTLTPEDEFQVKQVITAFLEHLNPC